MTMLPGLFTRKVVPTTKLNLSSELIAIKEYLGREKILSYLVGGYVRDTLLQRDIVDIDIAVSGDALILAQKFSEVLQGNFILLDAENHVARVVFRKNDKQFCLDISALRGSIEQDLSLRDFTIDAMAIDMNKLGEGISAEDIIDPFKGQSDIIDKFVRVVSNDALQNDPIRMLRAVRLAAEMGFVIEKNTEVLIMDQHQLLANVALERINEELCHLFSLPETSYWLRILDHLRLLEMMFPELDRTRGVEQPIEHYWDVYNHLIETVATVEYLFTPAESSQQDTNILSFVPLSEEIRQYFEQPVGAGLRREDIMKIAALLHDIAKPQTKIIADNGRTRFFGHDKDSAEMAAQILTRLRFSNRQVQIVRKMIELHMRVGQMTQPGELPTHRAIYRYFRDAGDVAIDTLFFSLADHLAARGPNLDLQHWKEHADMVRYTLSVCQEKEIVQPPKLVDGHDLMNIFGLQPGPKIKKILEAIREMQAAGEITTRDDALTVIKKWLL